MRQKGRQIAFGGERGCKIASPLSSKAFEPAAGRERTGEHVRRRRELRRPMRGGKAELRRR
jgi:hypothetical protein